MAETATKPRKAAAPSAPMPTHAPREPSRHELPAHVSLDKSAALGCRLSTACALLELLTLNLDSEMEKDGTESDDVMGVLQHVDLLLHELHRDIGEIVGMLPDDLRWRTFEARAIVSLAERMTFDDGWSAQGYDATMLIWCFDAAKGALQRAQKALDTMEPRNG
jgi:hypothetical protein